MVAYLRGCLSLSLLCLLVELLDGLLDDVGPKVTLKVRDVRHTVARVCRVLEQVLQIYTNIIKFFLGHWYAVHNSI